MLNDLRSQFPGLDPLTDPGTPEARVDLLFSERAFWLFTRGTRLPDLRRLTEQYGRLVEDVFPHRSLLPRRRLRVGHVDPDPGFGASQSQLCRVHRGWKLSSEDVNESQVTVSM